ncbi:MAG: T9SS C-terminal target domain-containing protein [Bacteroidetes bacterium]|jgi:Secretion system C-terminal sorting domain|nr:MAG: T9SS C-terminal target domain-containing protein [Bacteroidota bacterium]
MKWTFILVFSLMMSALTLSVHAQVSADIRTETRVYPNPSSNGTFALEISSLQRNEPVSIKVFNLIGNEVMARVITPEEGLYKGEISLSALPKGVYILEVASGSKKQTRRLSYI